MIFFTHIPSPPLNSFIDSFVYFKIENLGGNIERFLPDGNTELVIDLTDDPQFIYDNDSLHRIQECNRVWLSGIRTRPISIPGGGSEMFVVYFKKGSTRLFTRFPLNEITDRVTNADLLFGPGILYFREALQNAGSAALKFRLAERFFLSCFDSYSAADPAVMYFISNIVKQPDAATVQKLTSHIGYSHKHFIKLFREHTGITPKSFQRIMRFQKVILDIENRAQINWPQLATACGYFDQSHFISDFKHFSGFTPVEYMQLKGPDLNYVPVG